MFNPQQELLIKPKSCNIHSILPSSQKYFPKFRRQAEYLEAGKKYPEFQRAQTQFGIVEKVVLGEIRNDFCSRSFIMKKINLQKSFQMTSSCRLLNIIATSCSQ